MIVENLFYIFLFSVCEVQPAALTDRNETHSADIYTKSGSCEAGWLDAGLVDLGCLYFLKETKVY